MVRKGMMIFLLFLKIGEILLLYGHYVGLLLSSLIYLQVEQSHGNFVSLTLPSSYLAAPVPLYLVMIITAVLFAVLWIYEMHLLVSGVSIGSNESPRFIKILRVVLMGFLIGSIVVTLTLFAYLVLSIRNQETAMKMNYFELPGLSVVTLILMIVGELGSLSLVYYLVISWVRRLNLSRSDPTASIFVTFPTPLQIEADGPASRLRFDGIFKVVIYWALGLSVAFHCHGSVMVITKLAESRPSVVVASFVASLVLSLLISTFVTVYYVISRRRELEWSENQAPMSAAIRRGINALFIITFLYGIISLASGGYTIAMYIVRLVYYGQWADKAQFEFVQILTIVPVCVFYLTFVTDALMRHQSNVPQSKYSLFTRIQASLAGEAEYQILSDEQEGPETSQDLMDWNTD